MKKLFILALLGVTATANAHLMFPAQDVKGYKLKLWADDHWEVPKTKSVISVHAYQDGKLIKAGYDFTNGDIEIGDSNIPDILTSEYDFGHYTFTKNDHYPASREYIKGAIYDSRHIYKLGKSIYRWNEVYSQPVGMKIEVTPLINPLTLHTGDTLPVFVTLEGKPFANAKFEDQVGKVTGITTNAKGLANITLRKPQDGFYLIGTSSKQPYTLTDNKAQTLQLTGVLAFKRIN